MASHNLFHQRWSSKHKNLIEIVEKYPVLYTNDRFITKKTRPQYIQYRHSIWQEVSAKVNTPAYLCRRKFHDIKFRYAKLKHMIKTGRVSEKEVRGHKRISKYLDGTLDFLETYLCDIPLDKTPASVEAYLETAFPKNPTSNPSGVYGIQKPLIKIMKVYSRNTDIQPMSILPNNENNESESSINRNKHNFFIEDPFEVNHEAMNQSIMKDISVDETAGNTLMDLENVEHILPDIEVTSDPLEVFLMKHNVDKETDLKQYMQDLADVLCSKLACEKRKDFLSQIDLIVSEILEG